MLHAPMQTLPARSARVTGFTHALIDSRRRCSLTAAQLPLESDLPSRSGALPVALAVALPVPAGPRPRLVLVDDRDPDDPDRVMDVVGVVVFLPARNHRAALDPNELRLRDLEDRATHASDRRMPVGDLRPGLQHVAAQVHAPEVVGAEPDRQRANRLVRAALAVDHLGLERDVPRRSAGAANYRDFDDRLVLLNDDRVAGHQGLLIDLGLLDRDQLNAVPLPAVPVALHLDVRVVERHVVLVGLEPEHLLFPGRIVRVALDPLAWV